jgi:hypothetical protein
MNAHPQAPKNVFIHATTGAGAISAPAPIKPILAEFTTNPCAGTVTAAATAPPIIVPE